MRRKGQQISKEIAMLGMRRVTFRGLRLRFNGRRKADRILDEV